eukprot:COSAG05_NODE_11_length_38500_cov_831.349861_32_plen_162_part_00
MSLTEQSEPAVSGHGRQAPELQLPGVWQLPRSSPTLQPQLKSCQALACQRQGHAFIKDHGLQSMRARGRSQGHSRVLTCGRSPWSSLVRSQAQRWPYPLPGIGIRDHMEKGGEVPVLTKTGLGTGNREPLGRTSCCLSSTKSNGCCWKQSSVIGSAAGQSR